MTPSAEQNASPCVYLVDDDDAVRAGIGLLLESVGLAVRDYPNPAAFLEAFDPNLIGCVLLDLRMPVMSGQELLERMKTDGVDLPVILMTGHGDVHNCRRAFRAGAVEFLLKPVDEQVLLDSVQQALRAHIHSRQRSAASEAGRRQLATLSPREREVLDLVVDGLSNKQIGQRLGVSYRTVEVHRGHVFDKLGVGSLAELIRLYLACLPAQDGIPPRS